MYRIDQNIQLDFKDPKYRITTEKNDEGQTYWSIVYDPKKDADGNDTSEIAFSIQGRPDLSVQTSQRNIKSDFCCCLNSTVKEAQILFFTLKVIVSVLALSDGKKTYIIIFNRTSQPDGVDEHAALIAKHMNACLAAMKFGGKPIKAARITKDMILEPPEPIGEDGKPIKSRFVRAVPEKGQHSQLDFQGGMRSALSAFGGIANMTGTEFACESLDQPMFSDARLAELAARSVKADTKKNDLPDRAKTLSQIFYTSVMGFDAAHDRKSEIAAGLIQRAYMYDALRSFGWTLAAYCDENKTEPKDVDFETLSEIIAFVRKYGNLNYKPNSYLPVLCTGDDIHTYYIPDSVSAQDRSKLKKHAKLNDEDKTERVLSLDGYRKDLEYMWPAMLTIARELNEDRDEDEALEGDAAEILYAWCAVAVGSKTPFFTEDGPVNNIFEHPLSENNWELMFAKQHEEQEKQHAEEWLKAHSRDINRGASITFRDKKFVFNAYFEGDERIKILEKLAAKGGLERSAVSGQTDYLVCDPKTAGDSGIRAIKEQRIKGRCQDTKVVLVDDFFRALGYTAPKKADTFAAKTAAAMAEINRNREALAKFLGTAGDKPKPAEPKKPAIKLTYTEGLKFENADYTIDIPDGFVIDECDKERDFIAYLPDESDPKDPDKGKVQIIPGKLMDCPVDLADPEVYSAFYCAFIKSASAQFGMFKAHDNSKYDSEEMPGAIDVCLSEDGINVQALVMIKDKKCKSFRVCVSGMGRADMKGCAALTREILDHIHPKHPIKYAEDPSAERFVSDKLTGSMSKEWCSAVESRDNAIGYYFNMLTKVAEADFQKDNNIPKLKKVVKENVDDCAGRKDKLIASCIKAIEYHAAQDYNDPNLAKMKKKLDELIGNAEFTATLDGEKIRSSCPNIKEYKQKLYDAFEKPKFEAAKKQYEADMAIYRQEFSAWEEECDCIKTQRAELLERKLAERKASLQDAALEQYERSCAVAQEELNLQVKRKSDAEKTLAALGALKFKQKKEQRAIIEDAAVKMAAANTALGKAKSVYDNQMANADKEAESSRSAFQTEIAKSMPLSPKPKKPVAPIAKKPDNSSSTTGESGSGMTPVHSENKKIKAQILKLLADGTPRTVVQIMGAVPSLSGASNQKASALVRQLVEEGALRKEEVKRKAYFTLN